MNKQTQMWIGVGAVAILGYYFWKKSKQKPEPAFANAGGFAKSGFAKKRKGNHGGSHGHPKGTYGSHGHPKGSYGDGYGNPYGGGGTYGSPKQGAYGSTGGGQYGNF